MTLESSLRDQLRKAFGQQQWEENPLVAIGLSHAILSLKVTDEQLFRIVRSYVRQLAAAVHPDSADPLRDTQPPENRKIMVAFELLDNESNFQTALDEFRNLKAEDRHEITILRAALRAKEEQLDRANEDIRELGKARRQLKQDIGEFNRQKVETARRNIETTSDAAKTVASRRKKLGPNPNRVTKDC
jgi:chromosome segregation ATPase